MFLDEIVIEPVVFDHEVQDALEQGDITAGLDREEEVASACQRSNPRIDDDDVRAVFAGLPHVVGGDGGTFGHIRAADPNQFCIENVVPRVGGPVDSESLLVAGGRTDHAEPPVVVDVGRAQANACKLAQQVGLLRRETGPAQHGKGRGAVLRLDTPDRVGNSTDGLIVGHGAKAPRGENYRERTHGSADLRESFASSDAPLSDKASLD